ncbi:MAG: bifunctional hydroxymethylpyrimidine kinase/phosphomethylpyrimidine kinase [Verrucomicrobia bacterium]|nr:bifunctional hydroxymethylpyrimidine kinase/phosphomethylpyrimidine kinase [Verrucomicrobiota bacterium]
MKTPPCVLTIAGSDSGAGAGLQADSRTIHALGGYALTAVTAVTAQNTRGVVAWKPVAPALLAAQIAAVAGDFSIAAAKTGLLPGAAAVKAVAAALPAGIALVIDPVIGSTSGTRFLTAAGVRALKRHLLPRATLITPNWPEAALLTGLPVTTFSEAEEAARALLVTGCAAVLVKGGHAPGKMCKDCLVTADGRVRWFAHARVPTRNTHGTGCVLSAAIATGLARGRRVEVAVRDAVTFLQRNLRAGRRRTWGGGAGPAFAG